MKPHKFFYPVLEALDQGWAMRVFWAFGLRCAGVLFAIGGIFVFVEILSLSLKAHSGEYTAGGILFGIAVLVTAALVVQVFFYRASCIDNLPDSRFVMLPILSIMVRTSGEAYAVVASAVAIGGCLFLWIAKGNPLFLLPGLKAFLPSSPAEGTFLGGLVFAGILLPVALVVLMLAYFIAESVVVLADIATNIHILKDRWIPGEQPDAVREPLAPSLAPALQKAYGKSPRISGTVRKVQGYYVGPPRDASASLDSQISGLHDTAIPKQTEQATAPPAAMQVQNVETERQPVQQLEPPPEPQTLPAHAPQPEPRQRIRIVQHCRTCAAELAPGNANCQSCGTPV